MRHDPKHCDINRETLPVLLITLKDNEIAQHYTKKTVESWKDHGYHNIRLVNAVTPETIKNVDNPVHFSDRRTYMSGRSREWNPIEKAIWESHRKCWEILFTKSDSRGIIIEHDCILHRALDENIYQHQIASFCCSPTKNYFSLAAAGYWVRRRGLACLMTFCKNTVIHGPVDGYIHSWQYGRFPEKHLPMAFVNESIHAFASLDEEVGTTKPKLHVPRKGSL